MKKQKAVLTKVCTANTMRIIELKNQKEGFDLNIKRFYPTGSYTVTCPYCQSSMVDDLNENYLFEPCIGKTIIRYFICQICDTGYQLPIKLKSISVEIEVDESKLKTE